MKAPSAAPFQFPPCPVKTLGWVHPGVRGHAWQRFLPNRIMDLGETNHTHCVRPDSPGGPISH